MELFKLFGTIAVDNSAANNSIDETTDKAEKSHPKISAAFEKIGAAAVQAGQFVASGLAAGAAAIGALAKSALDSYADYEQLVGGVETLFKNSGATVMGYAQNAYTTAGMSANEYMETVTSFSASLIQSLEGDTDKAADVANRAITDMSDNANKMGTDIASIQNAYQGFAKQNFTMLDNLKLGYGGTKEEMGRLLEDAAKLKGLSDEEALGWANRGTNGDFALIIEAIGIIQNEMGITGTTAKEASATISGSLAATKSAWQNLLTGFADGNQDMGVLVGQFVTSATTALHNIVPRVAEILAGISGALPQIMAAVAAELPLLMESLLPGLITGAVTLVIGLAQMVPSLVQMLFTDLPYYLSVALSESANPALASLGSLFLDIGEFWREVLLPAIADVGGALGTLLGAVQPIISVFPTLFTKTGEVTNGFDIFRNVCSLVEGALAFVSEKIVSVAAGISTNAGSIQQVIQGLWEAVQNAWNSYGQPCWDAVQKGIEVVAGYFAEKMPEIQKFVSQCFTDIGVLWTDHLKPCLEAIGDFVANVLAPIFKTIFIESIVPAIETAFGHIKNAWNNVLKPVFTGITDFLAGVFTGNWRKAFEGLVSIVKGVFNGIIGGVEIMVNSVVRGINKIITGINNVVSKAGAALGLNVSIPSLNTVSLPRLEKGGLLEKGQIGLLEGNGAEAVVPLDRNRAWISAVAKDMDSVMGGGSDRVIDLLERLMELLGDYFPQLLEAAGHDIVTDDGAIIARYAPHMNAALGRIATKKERGR